MTISNEQLLQDVFTAYYDARRNKRNTDSQVKFEMALEHNLVALYEEIPCFRHWDTQDSRLGSHIDQII